MEITILDVLKALENDISNGKSSDFGYYHTGKNLLEASRKTTKRPAFVKLSIEDEDAEAILAYKAKKVGIMFVVDIEEYKSKESELKPV